MASKSLEEIWREFYNRMNQLRNGLSSLIVQENSLVNVDGLLVMRSKVVHPGQTQLVFDDIL